jgi:phi13 family phage major tail protein
MAANKVTIGLRDVYYAKITEDATTGEETYSTPSRLAPAITAELGFETASEKLYADDGVWVSVDEITSGTISLGTVDIPPLVGADLFGSDIDGNNVQLTSGEDQTAYIALGFRAKAAKGGYQYVWLYRVKFTVPGSSYETKGDGISFQTPSIEGTFEQRHKVAVTGKHPLRAAITDNAATPAGGSTTVTQAWFTEVYEPVAVTTPPENAQAA